MSRPKKYHSAQQRRVAKRQSDMKYVRKPFIRGKYFRLVIPSLDGYGEPGDLQMEGLGDLKRQTVDLITSHQSKRGLEHYMVSCQTHAGSGLPHLDILLVYSKMVQNPLTRYDYLVKHGDLTRYRTLNRAILDYGRKQDSSPLGDLDTGKTLAEHRVGSGGLYAVLRQAMMADPFGFNPHQWLHAHELDVAASKTNVYKAIRMVRDMRKVVCDSRLRAKPGIRPITRELIESKLSPDQLVTYDGWSGYQTIVDHINVMTRWRWGRPHKSSNLLLVGRPNTGKSTLARSIAVHCSTYPMGVDRWFPAYESGVYDMLVWDQFNMRVLTPDNLLKLLEGAPMQLPVKGGHATKRDNPLVFMTSNESLISHIRRRFKSPQLRGLSVANLGVRICQVTIPGDRDLFLLLGLFIGAGQRGLAGTQHQQMFGQCL